MEVKRKRIVTLACTFCKKRHIKCDGSSPCLQCVSRNNEKDCVFETNRKRGRKVPKDLQVVVPLPKEIQISAIDESFHPTFLYNFMERFAPLYPHYTPKTFSCSTTVTISDGISWNNIRQLTPSVCITKSLHDLVKMAEYTISCALGI